MIDPWAVLVAARQAVQPIVGELLEGGRREGDFWLARGLSGGAGDFISVKLTGRYAGAWRSQDGVHRGDLADLVAMAPRARCGGDRCAAPRWLATRLGMPAPPAPVRPAAAYVPRQAASSRGADTAMTREAIAAIWRSCAPLTSGDPVCSYLRGQGTLIETVAPLPSALRFGFVMNIECHLARPAMVAAIPDASGSLVGLHVTWIGKVGDRWQDTRLRTPRQVLGEHEGHLIRLHRGASGLPLDQAPCGETVAIGASLAVCLRTTVACPGLRTLCAINSVNLAAITLPPTIRFVILLRDRNGSDNVRAAHWFHQSIARFAADGLAVRVANAPRPGERAPATLERAA